MRFNLPKIYLYSKVVGVLLLSGFFFEIGYNNFKADLYYERAQDALAKLDFSSALGFADRAIQLNPMEPNYYRMRSRVYISYLTRKEQAEQKMIKSLILRDLATAYSLNPQNLVTMRNLVPLYYFVAAKNISVGASPENVDQDFVGYVHDFYRIVKTYSFNDVGVYALVAKYEKRLNMLQDYEESYEKVRELRPDLLEWYESFK